MRRKRDRLIQAMAAVLSVILLAGCIGPQETEIGPEEETIEESEQPVETWLQTYTSTQVVLSEKREAILFQQECEGGFLALINSKVREDIPEELRVDPDFVNDGRYDVYENVLYTVTDSGKKRRVSVYRTVPKPENPDYLEQYYSEVRPRAFRVREDGCIVALESTYETWLTYQMKQTRDRYYIRLLRENGSEISCSEIAATPGEGLVCSEAVLLGNDLVAIPQGKEVVFFGLDGNKVFSVAAPFPIRELCGIGDGRLAVILDDSGSLWVSEIDSDSRTAGMPQRAPAGAHSFRSGGTGELLFLRNSELYRYDLQSGMAEKMVSLLSLGICPSEVGAFFADSEGRLHFLLHTRDENGYSIGEQYLIASPCEIPTERVLLRIGFEQISDRLTKAILDYNQKNRTAFLEAVDFRNIGTKITAENLPDLAVMDEELYDRLLSTRSLADLLPMLQADTTYREEALFPSVRNALSDGSGAMRRLAASFAVETMACDRVTVSGRTQLNFSELRSLYADMPAGSTLYEPYYTSARLMNDLCLVNRDALGDGESYDSTVYAKLLNFSSIQPASYSYYDYASDSSSMESRIYDEKLLLLQAHIASLNDLKWYDAFFDTGACFVGWPTETGSASQILFEESLGISAACTERQQAAAWTFVRTLLTESYEKSCGDFPVSRKLLEKQMDEDAATVFYKVDDKGKYETDSKGNRIEIPRDTWYSPEWRRHDFYALTNAQRGKLLTLIEHSV